MGEVMTRQPLWERRISPELGAWEGRSVDWGRGPIASAAARRPRRR